MAVCTQCCGFGFASTGLSAGWQTRPRQQLLSAWEARDFDQVEWMGGQLVRRSHAAMRGRDGPGRGWAKRQGPRRTEVNCPLDAGAAVGACIGLAAFGGGHQWHWRESCGIPAAPDTIVHIMTAAGPFGLTGSRAVLDVAAGELWTAVTAHVPKYSGFAVLAHSTRHTFHLQHGDADSSLLHNSRLTACIQSHSGARLRCPTASDSGL
ncbi:hypothetical protein MAC_05083 [Metarhizium acridum CQMa 102]|uniref:Uncharacterized protein n=1 Tax=Metarhizium acridum (strain CQMa 102) TaxID=655827 RepID=E9E5D5_METAQ|nr:uncharacterized protein MAC_05083 [Metarhizium acridum CQMa 102]EFY88818.1 hypothetical protein MAC_05083 [Metarhizium acridum CQMa 102]